MRGVPGATARPVGNRHHHVARRVRTRAARREPGHCAVAGRRDAGCAAISPELAIDVWPHPEGPGTPVPRIVRVAILGNLSPEKGLHVVAACARDARERGLPLTFRVLGSTTEPIPQAPDAPLTIYGQYVDSELPQLIAAEKPDVLLFAAQVPETYAYTLSVALQSGLPIVASALGAFPERLAGVPRSTTVRVERAACQVE